jgi:hypothetical protein
MPKGEWVWVVANTVNDPLGLMNHDPHPNAVTDKHFRTFINQDSEVNPGDELDCDYAIEFDRLFSVINDIISNGRFLISSKRFGIIWKSPCWLRNDKAKGLDL